MEGINEGYLDGEYDLHYELSNDKKYIVIRYKEKMDSLDRITNKKSKGVKSLVNRFFNLR